MTTSASDYLARALSTHCFSHTSLLHSLSSDIEVLKTQLKAIAKVHFSVDLSMRDSHAHMQLLISFWDKYRFISFAIDLPSITYS
jgi:hypothetical protein